MKKYRNRFGWNRRKKERLELFTIGSIGYSLIEVLWRGFTHWTMALTGGFCFTAIYYLNERFRHKSIWKRCLIGSIIITAAEFVVGCVVNLLLKWDVWDYSKMRANILGQVCLLYSVLWFVLSFPICWLSGILRKKLKRG